MPSVLHLITDLGGGVASYLRVLIPQLEERGIKCGIYAEGGEESGLSGLCSLPVVIAQRRKLIKELIKNKYNIIHATSGIAYNKFALTTLNRFRGNTKIVCTVHGSLPCDVTSMPADAWTAVSQAAANALQLPKGVNRDLISVIPNAADPTIFTPSEGEESSPPILCWIGRTLDGDWECKDIFGLLHLVAYDKERNFRFVIVDTQDRSIALGLNDWFKEKIDYRVGIAQKELAKIYQAVAASKGAWISTSRHEGMPMCLVEAWACGCPVVVPRAPGFDRVIDGQNGLVYERTDSFEGIMECLSRLADPGVRQEIIQGGLQASNSFCSPEAMAKGYIDVYTNILKEKTKSLSWSPLRTLGGHLFITALDARSTIQKFVKRKAQ